MQPASRQSSAAGTAWPAGQARGTAWLGALVVLGIAIYVALDIVAQLLPPHYNPIMRPESDLAVGPYGWVMALNFVVRGLIALALVVGLRRALGPSARSDLGLALLVVWAVGDFLLAVFATDVAPAKPTLHGVVHLLVALIIFVAVALGELLLALPLGAEAGWTALRSPLFAIALAALFALVALPFRVNTTGLVERVFLGLALLWMLLAGVRLIVPRPAE
ncbi:MAG TPA: DUF998 domain-containing protein [Ktedonobacterales bacterium]|jgi:hypothetical membrane protein